MFRFAIAVVTTQIAVAVARDSRPANSSDWPQWRGPNRDAVCTETGLLQEWPAEGPPLLWKHTGLGGGYSTPSITGGKIYGMSYRDNDEVIWCLDEATQKELWVRKIAGKGRAGYNEGSRCTPTIDGNRLYAVGVSGDVVCLDIADGAIVWKKNLSSDFGGTMMSGWGFSESPLIDGDKCIVTPGADEAAVVALNKTDGATIWKAEVTECGGAGYASVMPAEVGGVRMYVTLLGKMLVGVAADDGRLLWDYGSIANRTANIPTVIVKGDVIFCSTAYQTGSAVLKLSKSGEKINAREVKFLRASELQNHHGGMVLVGNHVYLGHGHKDGAPVCVEMSNGNIAWKQNRGAGRGSAAVLYADGHLIFRWENGNVGLIKANPKEYKLKGTFSQSDRSRHPAWAHPVIVNGKMYLRDQDVLLCYDVKKRS